MKHYTPQQSTRTFWKRVDKASSPRGCWLWTGDKTNLGYGLFRWDGRKQGAHRVSWMLTRGDIPEGLEVCHNCPGGDNPSCVNPDHLWLGTHAQNMADKEAKGRGVYPTGERNGSRKRFLQSFDPNDPKHLPSTSPYSNPGERSALSKVTAAQVADIRARYAEGNITQRELATEHGLSQPQVSAIITFRSWKSDR